MSLFLLYFSLYYTELKALKSLKGAILLKKYLIFFLYYHLGINDR